MPPRLPPRLSVVVPSYRRTDLLAACLDSVARHAPAGTEVVVVDDGSPGGAVAAAAGRVPGVRVVRLTRRSGFCVAANAGVAAAEAPVVELLNDDAEVTAGWADAAVRWFADPSVAAVAPLVLQLDPARLARGLRPLIDSAGDEYDYGGFARKRGHGTLMIGDWRLVIDDPPPGRDVVTPGSAIINHQSTNHQSPGEVWGASAAAAFYRRDAVLRAGGFPADFGAYFEDVDLAFRLRRLGFRAWYDPASVVWHRVSASYGRRPGRRVLEQQSRNEERVFWRNVGLRGGGRWLPRHAAVLAGKAARRAGEGGLVPWAVGRVRAWVGR